ncbi:putative ubiquitin-associated/TS-N domain protein [Cucumis melo var. makuwa]|uniref:Uncharacterized protein LOC103489538 n=2 Tax=Cucumis melo TaxID=3656 RepID=A0A1S4DW51_CUCME|nr:uncharacterized protein LOC103489538 [Cucumis melo]KAA0034123.1 putative ubiquitin-associated/TS-N domain protein [Cucumis melo var. makuwa]TYK15797.1 putative ubiquitin-associated/TS-N domain protein [Cucumis melo var. makuwa]
MPVSKSKSASKDKSSARAAAKKQPKASKTSASKNSNRTSAATTAQNPVDELVHTVEISSTLTTSSLLSDNGHFQNMEDMDDHSSSPRGTVSDFDLSSNNGSCSGESEDPKEKTVDSSNQQERTTGCDHEKREKIRLKNEKKHQRQKEKRAQELHERCKGYLMSRKLEALSQQLVAMGFSPERATMALILNEGKLEESVAWLFEVNTEEPRNKDTANVTSGSNLKIDISSELAHISALEAQFKCSKQEVERAIVASGGDLDKAEGILREQKQKESVSQSNHEVGEAHRMARAQETAGSASVFTMQSSNREFSSNSAQMTVPAWLEAGNRSTQQSLKTTDQPRLLRGGEKRWPAVGSGLSSSTSTPPLPVVTSHPYAKAEAQIGVSKSEAIHLRREIPEQTVEPVVFIQQQPQSINGLQNAVSSPMLPGTTPWYSNNAPTIKNIISSDKLLHNHSRMILGAENRRLEQIYHQVVHNQPQFMSGPVEMLSSGLDIPWAKENVSSSRFPSEAQSLWKPGGGTLSSFTVPSSYGSSSNLSQGSPAQTTGLLSQMDWNLGGLMPYCDYNRIDWTLHSPSSRSSELSPGFSSSLRNGSGMRLCELGMQGGGGVKDVSGSGGLRDWTSPFAGNDLFSAPRQLVTSPFP